jgi:hypothetical protein
MPAHLGSWNVVEREIVKECMARAGMTATELFRHCIQVC